MALTGVDAGAHLEAQRRDLVADGTRAADRAAGSVEGRQETIACRINRHATKPGESRAAAASDLVTASGLVSVVI